MKPSINNEKADLLSLLKPMREQPGVGGMLRLLDVYVEIWKESLVSANETDVKELQGAIKQVRNILQDFKREIKQQEYRNGAYSGN